MRRLFPLATALLLSTLPTVSAAAGPVRLAVVPLSAPWSAECSGAGKGKGAALQERCGVLEALADEVRAGALAVLDPQQVMVMTREHTAQMGKGKVPAAQFVVSGTVTVLEGTWIATLQLHDAAVSKLVRTGERVKRASQLDLLEAMRAAAEAMLRPGLGVEPPSTGDASATRPPAPAPAPRPAASPPLVAVTAQPPSDPAPASPPPPAAKVEPPAARSDEPSESGMVPLPGGTFRTAEGGESVTVSPILMDATEVTADAYAACVRARKCTPPGEGQFATFGVPGKEDHPANFVDWNQASSFCAWTGKRLPTEEEWEWAARGASRGSAYPWGNERPADQVCWNGGNVQRKAKGLGPCAAGSLPAGKSPQGVADLVGNVWEWTTGTDGSGKRAVRGNGWVATDLARLGRILVPTDGRDEDLGFRCVRLSAASAAAPAALVPAPAAGKVEPPVARAEEPAPSSMVRVPGGTFKMAERSGSATVAPFLMDVTEVTADAYAACVKASKCRKPAAGDFATFGAEGRAGHPVNWVDWNQAAAYCAWAGKRLPSEEEWEWAARGADQGTTFPWGNERPTDQICWNGGNVQRKAKGLGTCAAGSLGAGNSPQGVADLIGNVWEWTSGTEGVGKYVARGNGWVAIDVPKAGRIVLTADRREEDVGFRCAKSPE